MSEKEYKYKRWGWGALIGLAAVIIIAGIVMGVSLSSTPKPADQTVAENNGASSQQESMEETAAKQEAERKAKEEADAKAKAEAEEKQKSGKQSQQEIIGQHINTTGNSSIPKTGPEDSIIPVIGAAVVAMLFAYNVVLFKKNA